MLSPRVQREKYHGREAGYPAGFYAQRAGSLAVSPVDFEQQTLADALNRAGFKADELAFFSMLGVVMYLTKTAVMETFKFVASLPAGTEIVFDYGILSSMLTERQRSAREYLARLVAAIVEPFITYFDPCLSGCCTIASRERISPKAAEYQPYLPKNHKESIALRFHMAPVLTRFTRDVGNLNVFIGRYSKSWIKV